MTDLEKIKLQYADANIALEIATNRFNEVKRRLVEELNKQPQKEIEKKDVPQA